MATENEKIMMFKYWPKGSSPVVLKPRDFGGSLFSDMINAEEGETWHCEIVYLTQEEIDNLPEHTGF